MGADPYRPAPLEWARARVPPERSIAMGVACALNSMDLPEPEMKNTAMAIAAMEAAEDAFLEDPCCRASLVALDEASRLIGYALWLDTSDRNDRRTCVGLFERGYDAVLCREFREIKHLVVCWIRRVRSM